MQVTASMSCVQSDTSGHPVRYIHNWLLGQ